MARTWAHAPTRSTRDDGSGAFVVNEAGRGEKSTRTFFNDATLRASDVHAATPATHPAAAMRVARRPIRSSAPFAAEGHPDQIYARALDCNMFVLKRKIIKTQVVALTGIRLGK